MLVKDIIPHKHINEINGIQSDPAVMMIKQCPIIPVKHHLIYYNGVDSDLLEGLTDLQAPQNLLDSTMCYVKLKVIVCQTHAETCIDEFCKTSNFCSTQEAPVYVSWSWFYPEARMPAQG